MQTYLEGSLKKDQHSDDCGTWNMIWRQKDYKSKNGPPASDAED